jgi:hypothetical protein
MEAYLLDGRYFITNGKPADGAGTFYMGLTGQNLTMH